MTILLLLALLLPLNGVQSFVAPKDRIIPSVTASPLLVSTLQPADDTTKKLSDDEGPQLGAWMPLGSASSLTGLTPVQIRVCGIDIAVWHEPLPKDAKKDAVATEWSALVDACPHRLAPLSQGRVDPESGCIECPYHGWQFDGDGALKALPQLEEGRTIDAAMAKKGAAATSLPVHAAGDLLFVFLPSDITGESWPISLLPEDHYPYLKDRIERGTTYYSRNLPYSLDFLLENFMDPAHIPFAHHSIQGTRDDATHIDMKEMANNFTHVECSFVDISGKVQRDGVLSFQRPAFYHFRIRANETAEYEPRLLIFTSPVEEGKCRVIMPDFQFKFVPKWLGHLGSNRFLNSDTWLHDAERAARMSNTINKQKGSVAVGAARAGRKPTTGLNYNFATESDLGPALFRRWWKKHGFADSPPNSFGPAAASNLPMHALSRAEQIDPWDHAKHCSSCRLALKRMRILQNMTIAGAAIGAILSRNKPPVAGVLILFGLYAHNFLRKFATTIEGNNHRSEIAERSVAAIK